MGVRPNTGNTFKGFTFDGIDSKTYGVYITQEAAYGAPERDVEMISIAGRNGEYALDKGRFLNTTVTYKAGITATDEASFAAAIRDFRNALVSRRGYCRLEDDYNTDEYRLAVYKSGLEVSARDILKAGEFTISFDCQPQRFLKSGETAVSLTSGDTLTNPTLFESSPVFNVEGGGSILFNGEEVIDVLFDTVGEITFAESVQTGIGGGGEPFNIDNTLIKAGDDIIIDWPSITFEVWQNGYYEDNVTGITNVNATGANVNTSRGYVSDGHGYVTVQHYDILFSAGTASTITESVTFTVAYTDLGASRTYNATCGITFAYDGASTLTISASTPNIDEETTPLYFWPPKLTTERIYGNSTVGNYDGVITIDCGIGLSYLTYNGVKIPYDKNIEMDKGLPQIATGTTTVTFSNDFSSMSIIPNWWRV